MRVLMAVPIVACVLLTACERRSITPTELSSVSARASDSDKPKFNLEVILRSPDGGDEFGHVQFRQDTDPTENRIDLGVWVRDLAPNTHYKLQRAADPINVVDGNCTSPMWLTLGKGLTPQDIVTDDRGTGREDLFRIVASPRGSAFDIRFRVVDAATMSHVVLISECYQYFIR